MNWEKKKWVVATSGGPDSMALLKICMDKNVQIAIAHVNYHHRPEAEEEEKYIRKFALENAIACYVLNEEFKYEGNFEAQARKYRYDFFKKVVKENGYDGVLVAHHKDDLFETYLMQKEKNLIPQTYGLAREMNYEGMLVYRPLLDFTKKELENICISSNIKYYIDCTNKDISLSRNYMRHEVLSKMSEMDKQELWQEIQEKNKHLSKIRFQMQNRIENKRVSLKQYRLLSEEERITLLHIFLKDIYRKDKGMSYAYKKEIDSILMKQNDFVIEIGDEEIVQENAYFFMHKKSSPYQYVLFSSKERITSPFFRIAETGKKCESVTFLKEDFPIVIRNAEDGDQIQMKFGMKKVHRFFIDRHIPLYKRKEWPVIVNKNGEVILLPGLGPDVNHYSIKPDFYVVQ